jgi:hypothetical protein
MIRPALFSLVVLVALPRLAFGYGAGVFGYSGKPPAQSCSQCHGGGAGPSSVTLSGPTALGAGEKATYTLDVVTGASTAHVGFDVAASDGTIAKIAGQLNESYVDSGELTHSKNWPKGATVQLMFSLTAPATAGTVTLYVNALRSDGVDDTGGDGVGGATLDVTVSAPSDLAGADLAGDVLDLAAVDAVSSATAVMPSPMTNAGPPHDEAHWSCDCRVGGRRAPPLGSLVVVAPLALLLRRRRRSSRS